MNHLHNLHIQGFKSIRDQQLQFSPLNVIIGANGTGKSNLIEVFRLLRRVASRQFQSYTGESGGANAMLHFGRKITDRLTFRVEFRSGTNANIYALTLTPTAQDRLVFEVEQTLFHDTAKYAVPLVGETWIGHAEAQAPESIEGIARHVCRHLGSYRIYHFHDTSPSARVKQTSDVNDNRFLREDAGNLAPFLHRLQRTKPDHFRNIQDTIRQIAPFFHSFTLEPSALNPEKIRLEWRDQGSDDYFNASALSDGTLRFMCLATLLLQPDLPSLILIDEPELGLHPAAIQLLAGLLKSAATRTQLIVATQSVTLVNHLEPQDVWVVDRVGRESVFRPLIAEDTSGWLEDYALGELWEKNVLGGRP